MIPDCLNETSVKFKVTRPDENQLKIFKTLQPSSSFIEGGKSPQSANLREY